jgi:hypothetical protein
MCRDWAEAELEELRWHWGSAYVISSPEPDTWIAQRRDTHETLRTDDPGTLLGLIRADYAARPVPRSVLPSMPRQETPRPRLRPDL